MFAHSESPGEALEVRHDRQVVDGAKRPAPPRRGDTNPPPLCGYDGATAAEAAKVNLDYLRRLREALDPPVGAAYNRFTADAVERALNQLEGTDVKADYVDCSELPCIARFSGAAFEDLAERLRGMAGFEQATVGGRGRTGEGGRLGAILVVWDEPPSADEQVRVDARIAAIPPEDP